MDGHWVAAAEIHYFGDKYYLAGTWNDHSNLIENIPRRYNVPTNQTQLLVADSPEGPYKPLVQEPEAFKGDNSGHGMLFTTFEGKLLFIIHHAEERGPRKPQLYEVDDSGDKLVLGARYNP